MLKHVGRPGMPGTLVAAAHMICNHDTSDGRALQGVQQYLQPVGLQRILADAPRFLDERESFNIGGSSHRGSHTRRGRYSKELFNFNDIEEKRVVFSSNWNDNF